MAVDVLDSGPCDEVAGLVHQNGDMKRHTQEQVGTGHGHQAEVLTGTEAALGTFEECSELESSGEEVPNSDACDESLIMQ